MPDYILAYPGDFDLPTGGYAYDRRIRAELTKVGWNGTLLSLGNGFPFPDAQTLEQASKRLAGESPDIPILIDGLAWGAMRQCAEQICSSHRIVALVHHPLGLETGLTPEQSKRMLEQEKKILQQTGHIVTTSLKTAAFLKTELEIPEARLTVAVPGNDPVPPATGRKDDKVGLISVGSIVPRKGHAALVDALCQLKDLNWILDIVGDDRLDLTCAAALRRQIDQLKLSERVILHGAVPRDQIDALYIGADMFVLASRYEGYGMAFTEAIAHGLPVVASGHGAVSDTIPADAGIVVSPDEPEAFRVALKDLILNEDKRARFRNGALSAAKNLPRWHETAARIRTILERA